MSNGVTQKRRAWDAEDKYRELLVKGIPTEIIGLFMAGTALVAGLEGTAQVALAWVWLVLCTGFTPLYLWFYPVRDAAQITMATIALPIWAMTILGSAWTLIDGWSPMIGGLFVLAYSGIASPLVAWITKSSR